MRKVVAAVGLAAAVFGPVTVKGSTVSVVPVSRPALGKRVLFRGLVDGDSVGDFPSVEAAKLSAERFLGVK